MKMSTVAVGDKVFIVREDGATKEISGQNGAKRFVDALKGDWENEHERSEVVDSLEDKAANVDTDYVRDFTGQGNAISDTEHSLSIVDVVSILEMVFMELSKEFGAENAGEGEQQ